MACTNILKRQFAHYNNLQKKLSVSKYAKQSVPFKSFESNDHIKQEWIVLAKSARLDLDYGRGDRGVWRRKAKCLEEEKENFLRTGPLAHHLKVVQKVPEDWDAIRAICDIIQILTHYTEQKK